MDALLLAAGYGKRLKPFTDVIPKPLMPINKSPLIKYWIEGLIVSGIEKLYINLHYKSELIEGYVRSTNWDIEIQFIYEDVISGTAGTILENKDLFYGKNLLVVHCDNFGLFDLNDFIKGYTNQKSFTDIFGLAFLTKNPNLCGILEVNSENIVQKFTEKPDLPIGDLANGAIYILSTDVINYILTNKSRDLSTEVLPGFINNWKIWVYREEFFDIGTYWQLKNANELTGHKVKEVPSSVWDPFYKHYLEKLSRIESKISSDGKKNIFKS